MCDWSYTPTSEKQTIAEIMKWRNVLCPKCSSSIIVTEKEFAVFRLANRLEIISKILHYLTFGMMETLPVHFDSLKFRK